MAEWDYGDYEGITTDEIRASRPGGKWDIWKDGCPGGESPDDIAERCDGLIEQIREIHRKAVEGEVNGDVLCVAHAHILRSFAARWLGVRVSGGRHFLLDAGGAGVLWYNTLHDGDIDGCSYEHHSLEEPAVDCWNITDGMIDVGSAQLILREGYWGRHLKANGPYLLTIGLKSLHTEYEYTFNGLQNTLPELRIERHSRGQSLDLLLHFRPSALMLALDSLNLVQFHFPILLCG